MTGHEFKYDVAFSFLARDEQLAAQLDHLLRDRLRTFLYSERQKELAGTDGESKFGKVFGELARVVVILYRAEWGETPWTRIEQTAIRNRAFDQGYDFALLVPLDEPPTKPEWFPKNRLWIGLERWGVAGAAAAIEARATEQGSELRQESLVDRAARSQRFREDTAARIAFLRSYDGVAATKAEVSRLREKIDRRISEMKVGNSALPIKTLLQDREAIVVSGSVVSMRAEMSEHYANSLEGARLEIEFFRGPAYVSTQSYIGNAPRHFAKLRFAPIGGDSRGFRWAGDAQDGSEFDSDALADALLKILFDHIDETAAKGRSRRT